MNKTLKLLSISSIALLLTIVCKYKTSTGSLPDFFFLASLVPASVTISNVKTNGYIQSGFLIGTAASASSVEICLDSGTCSAATGTTSWSFKLPTGANTWRDASLHKVTARSKNFAGITVAEISINIRKGLNKDINGDGYPDAVIGAEGKGAGAAYIFHSSSAGITATAATSANTTITGQTSGDNLGGFITFGDFNGDGFADLAISAQFRNAGAGTNQGAIYIFHSTGTGGITVTTASAATITITGQSAGDRLGRVGSGDINGDGYTDLVAGAPLRNSGQGAGYIFHSSGANGITISGAGSATKIFLGQSTGDELGTRLAVGDVTGDGYADIIFTAISYNAGTVQGIAYIFHSAGATGITNSATVNANTTIVGQAAGHIFGVAPMLGDLNGDGFADLIIGALGDNSDTGALYIFQSTGSAGITATSLSSAKTKILGQSTGDSFGNGNSIGDVNGDGFGDIVSCATARNAGAGSSQGVCYIFHSTGTNGITITSAASATTILTGQTAGDSFGNNISLTDLNSDGYMDLLAGSIQRNTGSGSQQGTAYIFTSRGTTGIATMGAGSANTLILGQAPADLLGIVPTF